MRIVRALEKLKTFFKKRGLDCTTTVLASLLTTKAVQAAPVGLANALASSALSNFTTGIPASNFFAQINTMAKIKTVLLGSAVVIGLTLPAIHLFQSNQAMKERISSLEKSQEDANLLRIENKRLKDSLVDSNELNRLRNDQIAYFKLRRESEKTNQKLKDLKSSLARTQNVPEDQISAMVVMVSITFLIVGFTKTVPPTVSEENFKNTPAFVLKLKQPIDPVSVFLDSKLTDKTRQLLTTFQSGNISDNLQTNLFEDLNSIIRGESLYNAKRFANVKLRSDTKHLLDRNPRGEELARLNRMFWSDGLEILADAKSLPPLTLATSILLARAGLRPIIDCNDAQDDIMSSSNWASDGLRAWGSILIELSVPSHFATTFTAPPPLVASTVRTAN